MSLAELVYAFAFGTYMVGVALAFRDPQGRFPVMVMSTGITVDFLVTLLPQLGLFAPLAMNVRGSNTVILIGVILGVVTWSMYIAALVMRRRKAWNAFLGVILATQLVWFSCYLSFLYGMHVYPLH
jgi:hypothetical protein